jgi:hypothetical protein
VQDRQGSARVTEMNVSAQARQAQEIAFVGRQALSLNPFPELRVLGPVEFFPGSLRVALQQQQPSALQLRADDKFASPRT